MKKLALGLALCLAVNVAQAAPGSNSLPNLFERIQTKLAEIKKNIGHNIKHGGRGGGGGGGVCR